MAIQAGRTEYSNEDKQALAQHLAWLHPDHRERPSVHKELAAKSWLNHYKGKNTKEEILRRIALIKREKRDANQHQDGAVSKGKGKARANPADEGVDELLSSSDEENGRRTAKKTKSGRKERVDWDDDVDIPRLVKMRAKAAERGWAKMRVYDELAKKYPDHPASSWQSYHSKHRQKVECKVDKLLSRGGAVSSSESESEDDPDADEGWNVDVEWPRLIRMCADAEEQGWPEKRIYNELAQKFTDRSAAEWKLWRRRSRKQAAAHIADLLDSRREKAAKAAAKAAVEAAAQRTPKQPRVSNAPPPSSSAAPRTAFRASSSSAAPRPSTSAAAQQPQPVASTSTASTTASTSKQPARRASTASSSARPAVAVAPPAAGTSRRESSVSSSVGTAASANTAAAKSKDKGKGKERAVEPSPAVELRINDGEVVDERFTEEDERVLVEWLAKGEDKGWKRENIFAFLGKKYSHHSADAWSAHLRLHEERLSVRVEARLGEIRAERQERELREMEEEEERERREATEDREKRRTRSPEKKSAQRPRTSSAAPPPPAAIASSAPSKAAPSPAKPPASPAKSAVPSSPTKPSPVKLSPALPSSARPPPALSTAARSSPAPAYADSQPSLDHRLPGPPLRPLKSKIPTSLKPVEDVVPVVRSSAVLTPRSTPPAGAAAPREEQDEGEAAAAEKVDLDKMEEGDGDESLQPFTQAVRAPSPPLASPALAAAASALQPLVQAFPSAAASRSREASEHPAPAPAAAAGASGSGGGEGEGATDEAGPSSSQPRLSQYSVPPSPLLAAELGLDRRGGELDESVEEEEPSTADAEPEVEKLDDGPPVSTQGSTATDESDRMMEDQLRSEVDAAEELARVKVEGGVEVEDGEADEQAMDVEVGEEVDDSGSDLDLDDPSVPIWPPYMPAEMQFLHAFHELDQKLQRAEEEQAAAVATVAAPENLPQIKREGSSSVADPQLAQQQPPPPAPAAPSRLRAIDPNPPAGGAAPASSPRRSSSPASPPHKRRNRKRPRSARETSSVLSHGDDNAGAAEGGPDEKPARKRQRIDAGPEGVREGGLAFADAVHQPSAPAAVEASATGAAADPPVAAPSSAATSAVSPPKSATAPAPALGSLHANLTSIASSTQLPYSAVHNLYFCLSCPRDFSLVADVARLHPSCPLPPLEGAELARAQRRAEKHLWSFNDDVRVLEGTEEARTAVEEKKGAGACEKRRAILHRARMREVKDLKRGMYGHEKRN
ncbi:hypothetical protein JCM8097_005975 [Rhodosporidiobolus ruineniae]